VAHELSEHMEHAAHHGGGLARSIGITIAMLGVLMALCSALVGAARTELIATMVEETGASLRYQTVSSKYRMLQAQLQQLHALMPDPKVMASTNAELKALEARVTNPDTAQGIHALRLEARKILNTVTPTAEDLQRFAKLIRKHHVEGEAAKEWAESYEDAVKVHSLSASRFEIAQLLAEFGIVIASVGLLLHKRAPWYAAILLGGISLGIVVFTYGANIWTLHGAEEKINETRQHFLALSNDQADLAADEALLHDIETETSKH
jgi:hypothetical protein